MMNKFTDQSESKHNQQPGEILLGQNDNIPIGLIISILVNNAYKDLIGEFENMHGLDMNNYLIKNHNTNKYTSKANQEHNFNIDCDTEEPNHVLITEKEIEII